MADHQYGLPDLSHLATGGDHFRVNQQAPEPYFFHRNLATASGNNNEATMVLPGGLVRFGTQQQHDDFLVSATHKPVDTSANLYGVDMESSGWGNIGINESGNCRWPRQETLTLLEIRSRLDSKFKEANQKKPLWDEVSRIMAEEHGYHRSEKKCREKFENLYKYYKKTKEGKAGRQDGKHYRFFRQLEALYGETTSNNHNSVISESHLDQNTNNFVYQTPNQENQETYQEHKLSDQSLSFSTTSEFETTSSGNNDNDDLSAIAFMMNQKSMENKHKGVNYESQSGKRVKRSWKGKVKDFVGAQMRELMESQGAWMERMMKTIEDREKERLCKEEEWRKQEMARFEQVHEFWARERAWVEARDKALMEALEKVTSGRELDVSSNKRWNEPDEISSLIQLVTSLETQFEQSGYSDESIWEEIAAKMASFGYYGSAVEFKEKWENMQMYFNKKGTWWNKNQTSSRSCYGNDQNIAKQRPESMELLSPTNNSYAGKQEHESSSCFNILINELGQQQYLWEKKGLKNKQT